MFLSDIFIGNNLNDYLQWSLSVKNLSINSTCAYQYVVAEQKMKRDCMNNLENCHTEGEH